MGHAYRMLRIAQAFDAVRIDTVFMTVDGEPAHRLFGEAGRQIVPISAIDAYIDINRLVSKLEVSAIAVDLFCPMAQAYDALSSGSVPIVAFDERSAVVSYAAAVINAIVFTQGSPLARSAALYEGPDYMILGPEYAVKRKNRDFSPEYRRKIFVGFGGSDTHNVTGRTIDLLNAVPQPVDIIVNLGPAALDDPVLQAAASRSRHNIEIARNTNSLRTIFEEIDFAICGGGVMLYELAAIGCPAAAIATEPHERATISYFADKDCVIDLGWEADLDEAAAAAMLAAGINDRASIERMRDAGPRLVDGNGLVRCRDILRAFVQ